MIAIWGANGFIGRHLIHSLTPCNEGLKIFARDFEGFPFDLPEEIQSFKSDFLKPEQYMDQMRGCRVIILLVTASHARTFAGKPEQEIESNVKPYRDFFKILASHDNKLEHVIFLSSGGTVYGKSEHAPIAENHALAPISPYGKGKVLIENNLIEQAGKVSWDYTILRVANAVGDWSKSKRLVNAVIQSAIDDDPLTIIGDGTSIRDYFDVKELVQSILAIAQNPKSRNKIFNVGCGQGHSILDVVNIVEEVSGRKITLEMTNAPMTDVPYNVLDCSKINNEIGWKAEKDLKDIIQTMWDER